jgi:hypothetical protein
MRAEKSAISLRKMGRPECEDHKHVKEQCVQDVHGEVDYMVARYAEAVYLVIERERQISHVPVPEGIVHVEVLCLFSVQKIVEVLDYLVFDYVMEVVKMKGRVKGVPVRHQTDQYQKYNIKGVGPRSPGHH